MSELHLVRHAQASFGAANYDQLSELGHRQSRWLGDYMALRGMKFDRFVVGDMVRHHETMNGICAGMGVDSSDRLVIPGLNEYNFVAMTDSYTQANGDDPLIKAIADNPDDKRHHFRLLRKVLSLWTQDRVDNVPETWAEFKGRVLDAQQQIMAMADSGNRILAIGSGGSISTFVGLVIGIPDENVFDLNLQYKNTAISHFFFNKQKMNLTGFNGIPHLDTNEMEQYVTYG
ncbi:histidine phosphatase family protein [SAR92 clade bacterium H921]|jgi:broad specificity phosphatase PhoE|nr:histidine phosphatase family protein [SAR92 clade bacterium H921]MDG0971204.1 histidine phosphatase family protein [Porticoccaceae bacterium]MDG1308404.1 histidine phosphatase family protein [Porticoccaceae bacterium]